MCRQREWLGKLSHAVLTTFRPPGAPAAFDGIWLAPILGSPEMTIPSMFQIWLFTHQYILEPSQTLANGPVVGEMEYDSRISGNRERLPIVVSVLSSPNKAEPFRYERSSSMETLVTFSALSSCSDSGIIECYPPRREAAGITGMEGLALSSPCLLCVLKQPAIGQRNGTTPLCQILATSTMPS
nr:hypothetical protein CFP56_30222 [Quercus suber]